MYVHKGVYDLEVQSVTEGRLRPTRTPTVLASTADSY